MPCLPAVPFPPPHSQTETSRGSSKPYVARGAGAWNVQRLLVIAPLLCLLARCSAAVARNALQAPLPLLVNVEGEAGAGESVVFNALPNNMRSLGQAGL